MIGFNPENFLLSHTYFEQAQKQFFKKNNSIYDFLDSYIHMLATSNGLSQVRISLILAHPA